jgi:predicted translin family RNA/ssDNA-binding protein
VGSEGGSLCSPQVIKGTRDVQKAAKQAIFSLHRGDTEGAGKKLMEAHEQALAIKREHLDDLPTLRQVCSLPFASSTARR